MPYLAFRSQTCLFLQQTVIPTHHCYSHFKQMFQGNIGSTENYLIPMVFISRHMTLGGRLKGGRSVSPRGAQCSSYTFCHGCSSGHYKPDLSGMLLWTAICELPVKLIRAKDQFPSDGSICLRSCSVRISVARNVKWDLGFSMDPSYAACVGLI